jgi:hypothetical protein
MFQRKKEHNSFLKKQEHNSLITVSWNQGCPKPFLIVQNKEA